jgi:hypothetical protein
VQSNGRKFEDGTGFDLLRLLFAGQCAVRDPNAAYLVDSFVRWRIRNPS